MDTREIYSHHVRPRLNLMMKWKWDCSLTVVAGILSLMCAVKVGGEKNDVYYRTLVIGSEGYDVLRIGGWVIVSLSLVLLYFGGRYMTSKLNMADSFYIGILVTLLVSHFLVALIFSEYKDATISSLRDTMFDQLETSKMAVSQLGVMYHLNELWDLLQVNMRCCGVETYQDYGTNPDMLPMSCCVLKQNVLIPQPENLAQCRHDLKLGVHSSAFIHTQGCHEKLLSWFMRYTSSISGLLFASISLQVLSVLYLIWKNLNTSQRNLKDTTS